MQLPPTSRPTRVRRLLAVSAAAVAVMIAPTACDYGAFGGPSAPAGHDVGDMNDTNMPGMDHGAHNPAQQPVVVPVGNTVESTPQAEASRTAQASSSSEDKAAARRGERRERFRDSEGRWRVRYVKAGQPAPTSATIPAPTSDPAAPPSDPAAPAEPGATGTATPVDPVAGTVAPADPAATGTAAPTDPATASATASAPATAPAVNNGLDVLGRDCTNSNLAPHDGFQKSPACVSTAMGEVAAEDQLPSLLITAAPKTVGVDQPFKLEVSTRNLVRDRFLGAAAGGYYLESSFLNGEGLQRGHFHTACRILPSGNEAPDSSGAPEFFLATQDNGGGSAPDTVTIDVPGIKTAGELQCTSWAGDGSHRTPMMTRANQTPAIDSVRITVSGDAPAVQNDVSAADAQADATQQAEAQGQEAGAQKPDQDGAPQPGAYQQVAPGQESAATTAPATSDAPAPTSTEAPAGN